MRGQHMEKISVIIPVYNDEKYLAQCLDSVLRQTYSNIEIILVDDGSTDSTPELCEKYREKYANIRILHKKNGGVGSSRNAGLEMATGEYILFVDHDDLLSETHIEELYKLLKKNDADIAVGNFNRFIEEKRAYGIWIKEDDYFEKTYTPEEWFSVEYETVPYNRSMIFVVPWGKLYKRSLFENIVYPINARVEDDLTTWKIYLLADKIAYMNKAIYTHRIFENSVSAQANKTAVFPLEAVEERISLLSQLGFDITTEIEAYRYRLNICIDTALKDGDYLKYRNAKQKLAILKKYKKI